MNPMRLTNGARSPLSPLELNACLARGLIQYFFMRILFLLVLSLPGLALAQEGRYRIDGVGPAGTYRGSAEIAAGEQRFSLKTRTFDSRAREVRYEGDALPSADALRALLRGKREGQALPQLRILIKRVPGEADALTATYYDAQRQVVRRESWTRTQEIEVPLSVVVIEGAGKLPGVPAGEAKEAQRRIEAQLNATFKPLGVHFQALRDEPWTAPGAALDRDQDGRLDKDECAALQGELERRGIKQPGRVVVVLTDAPFVHPGCRGWTPGDAPATDHTLVDPNDNLSIVGRAYLSPARFHTVAHEVGHQLGLDDLRPTNRHLLRESARPDHLMESGGRGFYLDPAILEILRRHVVGFPNHGLEGRINQEPIRTSRFVPPASAETSRGLPLSVRALQPPR